MLLLTVVQGPQKGKQFSLPDNEPQLIGRSSEALPITDNTVSRRHAELTLYIRQCHAEADLEALAGLRLEPTSR